MRWGDRILMYVHEHVPEVREDVTTPETIREIIRRSQPGARILRFNISGGELKKWTEEALREL